MNLTELTQHILLKSMRADTIKKSKSLSTISQPKRFGQLLKTTSNPRLPSKASFKDRSFTDSSSSDSSCFEKRYYKCGCLSHREGCHIQYRDYLSEMRQRRLRKASGHQSELDLQLQKLNLSQISERSEIKLETPKKEGLFGKIIEMSQSCQESNKKNINSLTIVLNGVQYIKIFEGKKEALQGITFIQNLVM